MQQRIVEFRKRNFWTNQVDTSVLNERLAQLNIEGWCAVSVMANHSFAGLVTSYTLLLERDAKAA